MRKVLMVFLLVASFFCVGITNFEAQVENGISKTEKIETYDAISDNSGKLTCNQILGLKTDKGSLMNILSSVYKLIGIGAVILVIVLSMMDFTKAVSDDDSDALNGSFKKLVKRLLFLVVFFLAPGFVKLIMDLVFGSGYMCYL